MNLEDYTKLKAELETKQKLANKAEGALAQLESQLMQEFGIELEHLPDAVTKLEEQIEKDEIDIEEGFNKWQKQWASKLDKTC